MVYKTTQYLFTCFKKLTRTKLYNIIIFHKGAKISKYECGNYANITNDINKRISCKEVNGFDNSVMIKL